MPKPPWENEEDSHAISECYYISFDIGENLEVATAAVLKQSTAGVHLVNLFQGDEAMDLYEFVTGEKLP